MFNKLQTSSSKIWVLLFILKISLSSLFAQDSFPNDWMRVPEVDPGQDWTRTPPEELQTADKYMTGDWGGWRDKLQNHGVIFTSSYTTDTLGNPVGGLAQGFSYAGSFGLNLDIDFDRALGWKGFEFFSSLVWRTGTSLSKKKDRQSVSSTAGLWIANDQTQ